jgi:hypothetical protein
MAYTARQLITRSWYLSGIVARNAQTPTGDQITDGLALLNSLLDFKSIQIDLIPYWTYNTSYSTVAGQESYFISNCLAVESVTFTLQSIRYAMDYVTRSVYFGSGRVNDIQTLPFNWNYNRGLGGGTLYLYFIPDAVYQLQIMGKFGLTDVTLDQNLLLVYDKSYLEYLRYGLAEYMCSEYGILFNPESARILKGMERQLMYISPPDLSMIKASILTEGSGLNYADINWGRGWRPS